MLRGTRSIYVDYVDYDEIAHHAGILRPESLEALEAVDGVLHQLELVASAAPRQLPLRDPVRPRPGAGSDRSPTGTARTWPAWSPGCAQPTSRRPTTDVEGWGRTRALVDELASASGVGGRSMQSASEAMDKRDRNEPDAVAPGTRRRPAAKAKDGAGQRSGDETFHVFGSGQPRPDLRPR